MRLTRLRISARIAGAFALLLPVAALAQESDASKPEITIKTETIELKEVEVVCTYRLISFGEVGSIGVEVAFENVSKTRSAILEKLSGNPTISVSVFSEKGGQFPPRRPPANEGAMTPTGRGQLLQQPLPAGETATFFVSIASVIQPDAIPDRLDQGMIRVRSMINPAGMRSRGIDIMMPSFKFRDCLITAAGLKVDAEKVYQSAK